MDKELKNILGRLEYKLDFLFNKLCAVEDFFKDDYYKKLYEEAKAKKENAEWELVNFIERGRNRGTIREEEQKAYRNYQEYEEILDKEEVN